MGFFSSSFAHPPHPPLKLFDPRSETTCEEPTVCFFSPRNLLAVALETDYTFKEAAELKELMSDPTKLMALAAAAVVEEEPAAEEESEEEAPAAKKDDSSEENSSDEDMGFSLFD